MRGGADLTAEFPADNCDTLKAFTEARSETVDDLVTSVRLARSDTPYIRVMARTLTDENGSRLPEESLIFQQLLEIWASAFIDAIRRQGFWDQWLGKMRDSSAHLIGCIKRPAVYNVSVALRVSYVCSSPWPGRALF